MPARRVIAIALAATCTACGPRAPEAQDTEGRAADVAAAQALLDRIPAALSSEGPTAWLEFCESTPAFMMVSDGTVGFADRPSAQGFLVDFARTVETMTLAWQEVRLTPLSTGVVALATFYEEEILLTDGSRLAFGLYVTGIAREGGGGWRLQHLHWSSPAPPGG